MEASVDGVLVALVKGNESFLQTPFFERKKCSHLLEDHQGDRQPQLLVLLQFLVVMQLGQCMNLPKLNLQMPLIMPFHL